MISKRNPSRRKELHFQMLVTTIENWYMVCKYFDIVIAFLPQQAFEVGEGEYQRSQAGNAYDQEVDRVHGIGVLGGSSI